MSTVAPGSPLAPEMLDIDDVRRVYLGGASARHLYRMVSAGLMPTGCKLGALRRWSRSELDAWVRGGCQRVSTLPRKHRAR